MPLCINISDRQSKVNCDTKALQNILENVFEDAGVDDGEISLAILADAETRAINARFLGRDAKTDVIAFPYERSEDGRYLDAEIVVNADEAVRCSRTLPHATDVELLFYAVHGALHLLGWMDDSPEKREAMNRQAMIILADCGVNVKK